jgi:hypothetical protein
MAGLTHYELSARQLMAEMLMVVKFICHDPSPNLVSRAQGANVGALLFC